MDYFAKYETMKSDGTSAVEVYRAALADGLDPITRIRLLRTVFGLSLAEAKEVTIVASESAKSLDDFQSGIAQQIEEWSEQEVKKTV
jgi:hypothetical protein